MTIDAGLACKVPLLSLCLGFRPQSSCSHPGTFAASAALTRSPEREPRGISRYHFNLSLDHGRRKLDWFTFFGRHFVLLGIFRDEVFFDDAASQRPRLKSYSRDRAIVDIFMNVNFFACGTYSVAIDSFACRRPGIFIDEPVHCQQFVKISDTANLDYMPRVICGSARGPTPIGAGVSLPTLAKSRL